MIALGHFLHLPGYSLCHWLPLAIYSLDHLKERSFLHLAIFCTWLVIPLATVCIRPFKRQIYHNSIWLLFALGQSLYLAGIWCLKIALGLHFHLTNHCTWTLSLGTLCLLDQNILLAKFGPKEFSGPREKSGQVIRMAKRNDTVSKISLFRREHFVVWSLSSVDVVYSLFNQYATFSQHCWHN